MRDEKGRFIPGSSGNPDGRPRKADELRRLLAEGADEAAQAVLEAAKGGDMHACRLVLERLVPAVRPAHQPVSFDLDPVASLSDQARQILSAAAQGELPTDQAKALLDALAALVRVVELDEIQRRLDALEATND